MNVLRDIIFRFIDAQLKGLNQLLLSLQKTAQNFQNINFKRIRKQ